MDVKNATILLIFLLCILGLIAGVYYTEASDSSFSADKYEESVHEDSNGTITIELVLKEKNEKSLDKFFT